MNVLVTGCNGFIGSHITIELLNQRYNVTGIDILENSSLLEIFSKTAQDHSTHFRFIKENVCNTTVIDDGQFNVVCHLAALTGVRSSIKRPLDYITNNVVGHTHLLNECTKNGNIPLVYASSSSVYGKSKKYPYSESQRLQEGTISPYALTKKTCEEMSRLYFDLHKQPSIGLRFFTVYGPRGRPDMAPQKFLQAIHANETIIRYGNGEETFRDFTFISDIVSGIMASIQSIFEKPFQCEIYNLGRGEPIFLNDFIKECELALGKTAVIKEEPLHKADVVGTHANISKARKKLNYNPTVSIKEGLKLTIDWMLYDVILTCYFTSKKDPQHDKQQDKNSYDYIEPWHSTMKKNNLNGIIFHDGLSNDFVKRHTTKTIKFQYIDLSQYSRDSLNDIRFYVYLDFLKSQKGVRRVFMTDVSDVYVVKTPFDEHFDDKKLYVGKDCGFINSNGWMQKKISQQFQILNNKQISKRYLVNAGVVGGSRQIALELLQLMINTFESLGNTKDNANMPVLNFVAWMHFSDRLIYGYPVTSEFRKYQLSRADVFFIHK